MLPTSFLNYALSHRVKKYSLFWRWGTKWFWVFPFFWVSQQLSTISGWSIRHHIDSSSSWQESKVHNEQSTSLRATRFFWACHYVTDSAWLTALKFIKNWPRSESPRARDDFFYRVSDLSWLSASFGPKPWNMCLWMTLLMTYWSLVLQKFIIDHLGPTHMRTIVDMNLKRIPAVLLP